jgi:hypothetical protein
LQDIADQEPQPIDLCPIIEAMAPLSSLEDIPPDLTEIVTKLSEISGKIVAYDLNDIKTALEDIRDRISDLKFNDEEVDFGFLRVLLKGKVIEYGGS